MPFSPTVSLDAQVKRDDLIRTSVQIIDTRTTSKVTNRQLIFDRAQFTADLSLLVIRQGPESDVVELAGWCDRERFVARANEETRPDGRVVYKLDRTGLWHMDDWVYA